MLNTNKPASLKAQLKAKQTAAVIEILSNDEVSTDAQLYRHFTKVFGCSAAEARNWIFLRDYYLTHFKGGR